ncbi:UDP-N-acetyl-D-mannosamine dehydrogenase [Spongiibacter tropicus]|jgi:UDP-N-acetyl-D-mannosaminuronic acid dehydrogenase|uniref:UDP-N-acetyl-D-mannosamine dehydrogenase n=1 Tax=Spongiibacter tropicus TaxID=454602 RepID=UPI000C997ADE|nr:UDP-N-acetyl-D-mannosamine dehydrogenase [Spongiibacter tropicus]MAP77924.1 UDP-N-acetyl-D-mannosamine dehydrogenase [Pseudomonadales bacterium]|tara:strand:- start:5406 stop:6644 length:1239 start_codon:yes stop_codon:yes gene_type:complete
MQFKTISMIGLGYIGLPTAAVFASRKIKVIGVDVNQKAVDTINRGEIHIVEPDLDMVVHAAVKEGYLRATTTPEPAEAFLIAVPTPFKGENHEPDLSYIESAAKAIAPVLAKGNLVILESTSPVGATEQMAEWLAEARPDLTFPQTHGEESDIRIAHCPERVLPGHVLRELVQNDRIIGGMTPKCSQLACTLYKSFVEGECVVTNARTAEMCKLAENSFRDVNIAFANELSIICDKLDIDVWELIKLANRHPRVNILQPGAGVGGHCIAVDPWFIVYGAPNEAKLIKQARSSNDYKSEWVLNKIADIVAELRVPDRSINVAIYGVAFKANIDDCRQSPALYIAEKVLEMPGVSLSIVEPNIGILPESLKSARHLKYCDLGVDADLHVLLVDHTSFKSMKRPGGRVIDMKGVW